MALVQPMVSENKLDNALTKGSEKMTPEQIEKVVSDVVATVNPDGSSYGLGNQCVDERIGKDD